MSKDEKKPALQRIGMVTYEGRESKSKKGDGELDRAPYNPSPEAVQDVEDFLIAVGLPREIKPPPEGWGVPAWYNHDNLDPVSKKTSPPLNRRHLIDAVTQARGSAQRRKASSQELQHFDTAESFINYFTKAGLDHEEINALATVLLTPALHGDNAIHTGKHQITVKKGTGEILIDNERIYLPGDMVSSESTWEAAKDRIEKVPVRYYGDSAAYQRVDAPAIMDDTLYPKAQQKPSKRELIDAV
ncbi:hypothetical protein KKD37_04755, partial [Patescibacteria group bacterium]|nr:hypothetical protein [Patescibacteria group bacterium]